MDEDLGFGAVEAYVCPGKLKKVLLKNFMCHDHFEIDLNPCGNFIHGQNGSGKSAIANALLLGFGQRASVTNRGVSVQSFIKRSRRIASIEITLFNCGNGNPYKYSDFGKTVTIIRKIVLNCGSTYKIRGESGNEETLSRHELENLLLHFNIQPNNPLCILSQDAARSFFKFHDPKQMYNLFMLGTQMQTIQENYEKNSQYAVRLRKECEKSEQELTKMFEDVIEADRKSKIAEELKIIQEQKSVLDKQLILASVKLWEGKIKSSFENLSKAIKEFDEYINNPLSQNENQTILVDQKSEFENKLSELKYNFDNLDMEIKTNYENILATQNLLKTKKHAVDKNKAKIAGFIDNINQLGLAIDKIQNENHLSSEYKLAFQNVVDKLQETEATIKTTENYCNQLNDTLIELNNQIEKVASKLGSNFYMYRDLELKLNQIREGNSLGVYGHWMPKLIDKIKVASERGMFKQTPRGPIGSYIQVVEEAWVPAIESFLRPMLSLFCVSCQEDYKVLNRLIDEVMGGYRHGHKPGMIISKFFFKVHNFGKNEVKTNRYKSLIRSLKINDPIVTNCLIDQMGIEQILLVPEASEALKLMEMEQNVPSNCKVAFTQQADFVYPAPNYRFYSGSVKRPEFLQTDVSQQIGEVQTKMSALKHEQSKLTKDKENLVQEMHRVKADYNQQQGELKNLIVKKRNFHAKKYELEKNFEFEPQSIEMYNDEIKEWSAKKQQVLKEIEALEQEIKELNLKIHENNRIRNDLMEKQSKLSSDINNVQENITGIEKQIREWDRSKEEFVRALEEKRDDVNKLKMVNEENNKKLAHYKKIIEKNNIKKEDVNKTPEQIKNILNGIEGKIKVFVQEIGGNIDQVNENMLLKKRLYENKKETIEQLENCIQKNQGILRKELQDFQKVKNCQTRLAEVTFTSLLKVKNLEGFMKFNFDDRKLQIAVVPNVKGSTVDNACGLNSLSGGERSYATVAFIRAIWSSMTTPFYVLDEFDVFTDVNNRSQIISLLTDYAKDNLHYQYIFITPLDLSNIVTDDLLSVHLIKNPRDG